MSYNSDFQKEFIQKSLAIMQNYTGPNDATILLNCLLGLVIVPAEQCFNFISEDGLSEFPSKWGIPLDTIVKPGDYSKDKKITRTNCHIV